MKTFIGRSKRLSMVFCSCLSMLFAGMALGQTSSSTSQALTNRGERESEGLSRLSEMILKSYDRRIRFSCVARIIEVKIGELRKDPPIAEDEEDKVNTLDYVVRTVAADNNRRLRNDIRYLHGDTMDHFGHLMLTLPEQQLEAFEDRKAKRYNVHIKKDKDRFSFDMHGVTTTSPFCFAGAHDFNVDLLPEFVDRFYSLPIIADRELADGTYELVYFYETKEGDQYLSRYVFAREPSWLLLQFDVVKRPLNTPKVDPRKIALDDCKNWKLINTTKTVWRKENEEFVPDQIHGSEWVIEVPRYRKTVEIDYLEWKFHDQVDMTLLDPEKFTSAELMKIPFDEWQREFEKRRSARSKRVGR